MMIVRATVRAGDEFGLIERGWMFDVPLVRAHCERTIEAGQVDAGAAELAGSLGEAFRLRGLARTARRLLDTLDGRCPWAPSAEAQPSECPHCIPEFTEAEAAAKKIYETATAWLAERVPLFGDDQHPRRLTIHPRAMHVLRATRFQNSDLSWADYVDEHTHREVVLSVGDCSDCNRTDHNLRGYLPPVEPVARK